MVGFYEKDPLTSQDKFLAGCLSGVTTRFITQPLDVMKLRLQLQNRQKTQNQGQWALRTSKNILREEGFFAFWHGHVLGQVHTILAVSCQFYIFELTTSYFQKYSDSRQSTFVKLLCGTIAGCASTALVNPLEVIRVRQMLVKAQYRGFINGAGSVYKSGGISAFYEGLGASLLQNGPQVGINFTIFSILQPLILGYFQECPDGRCYPSDVEKPEYLLIASSVAGMTSGFLSKTVTYPFDLIKRRLQIGSHQACPKVSVPSTARHVIRCTSLSECFAKTYHREGLKGFYRGWAVTVSKAQLTSVIAFTSYELICYFIRGLKSD